MARRKVNINRGLGAPRPQEAAVSPSTPVTSGSIDQLASTMSTVDVGFRPTDQRVYEINLDRILPDPRQPRRILPFDLRQALESEEITPVDALQTLLRRSQQGDQFALLVLGGRYEEPLDELDDDQHDDTGLLALAASIRKIGLRQPLNVYRIDDPTQPDRTTYRVGEGERRFWAHQLLVHQGHEAFRHVKCIVEKLPDNEEVIHERQEAENAARVDLPAMARARSIRRLMDRINIEMGTRVPGENTIKFPGARELQTEVGQRVKNFTGRAISDKMVRNYLKLLQLPPEAQDLAEAAHLSEKQLRDLSKLKTDEAQIEMVRNIIEKQLTGRQLKEAIATTVAPQEPKHKLREVSQKGIQQRLEERVLNAAKTIFSLTTMPPESYQEAVSALAARAQDEKTKEAFLYLRNALQEALEQSGGSFAETSTAIKSIALSSINPPLERLHEYLPVAQFQSLSDYTQTGNQVIEKLLEWRSESTILASHLEPFFSELEELVEALRAGEILPEPILRGRAHQDYPNVIVYDVVSGEDIYWTHELLVYRGQEQFKWMQAELASTTEFDPLDD